jgi:cytochrome c
MKLQNAMTPALAALAILFLSGCSSLDNSPQVLILAKSEFYVHESTPAAIEALEEICRKNRWRAIVADDPWEYFTEKRLPRIAAVVFLNTAGDVLNPTQEVLFQQFIQAGGGFVGIHTAVDTEHNWDWYGGLAGGRYESTSEVTDGTLKVLVSDHASTRHMEPSWTHTDEWFNIANLSSRVTPVLEVDETTYEGGTMGGSHPVSWYQDFDGGRAFVTTLGHTAESYANPAFLQHLEAGIRFAIGKNHTPLTFKPVRKPAEKPVTTGFVKSTFACGLYEPMEFDMLPDGRILLIERRGDIKLYDPAADQIKVVGHLDVFEKNEEGLIGMCLDPNWEENRWLYLYYSPEGKKETSLHLARFQFDGETVDLDSKQLFLEVKTDREMSPLYHAGGSIVFDEHGYLYLGAGDNTDHHSNGGYASIIEVKGRKYEDSQRSAANSMDLRGKILRIKPLPDGSYLCPADNLYTGRPVRMKEGKEISDDQKFMSELPPSGQSIDAPVASGKGRPEIYIMGVRNPFRIDIDDRRDLLLWGEPGPDATVDDENFGPRGYDEFNIASKAGYFGWPYYICDNKPYRDYDWVNEKPGPWFDVNKPYNDSPNNTGEKILPPPQPALIWYPFASSPEFPELFNGTRCAMGGPVYWTDEYPAETRFPDRFNGTWFIYEWMRNWVLAVELDSLNQYAGIHSLPPSIRFFRPMDMLIDKNGSLWILEYGTEWYSQNPDACITRLDYKRGAGGEEAEVAEGANHPPVVSWDFGGKNRSFFKPGDQLRYRVNVADEEDGSVSDMRITPDMVDISMDYLASGKPGANYKPSALLSPFAKGKALAAGADCLSCHAYEKKINGPSYLEIAERYKTDKENALKVLPGKIINGGAGNWGDTPMIGHPDISNKEAADIAAWIMSLADPVHRPRPFVGTFLLQTPDPEATGAFLFHASYKDKGLGEHPPLAASQILLLRNPLQQAEKADELINARVASPTCEVRHGSALVYKQIDLKGIEAIEIALESAAGGGRIELHLGSPEGRLAGSVDLPAQASAKTSLTLRLDRSARNADGALHDVYFVVKHDADQKKPLAKIDWFLFKI